MDNVTGGSGETITIDGQARHVSSYLRDFLFPPERLHAPVSMLSGGERNRLLLARLFAKPSNLLVMDEPTNDLDAETLDLLEEMVAEYAGTLLLVSHDRAFLDNVVTSTLVFEGEGRVNEYVGGYSDWLRQRRASSAKMKSSASRATVALVPAAAAKTQPAARTKATARSSEAAAAAAVGASLIKPRKLSYKEQRELEEMPGTIQRLEAEQSELTAVVGDPELYRRNPADAAAAAQRLQSVVKELETAFSRWETLEAFLALTREFTG
jgi:ATP-binding cassette subfamily F protein uup